MNEDIEGVKQLWPVNVQEAGFVLVIEDDDQDD
jgi:hypothetical protein